MDKEKIIVVLLIVTILLSIGSIIFTVTMNTADSQPQEVRSIEESESSGSAGFEIITPAGGAG